jgi:predicted short-subunit dehydrogenase-like oxidoreductase (DUF2520 family)
MNAIPEIAIIGTGNVAGHLLNIFLENGIPVCGVYGRNRNELKGISERYNVFNSTSFHEIPKTALVLVCVSDSAISNILEQLPNDQYIAYTSGGVELHNFKHNRLGVFYPLQSFTKGVPIDFSEIPILIESNNPELLSILANLARNISNCVVQANSEERFHYHLAAVFSNNFVNHLFTLSADYLEDKNLDFRLLHPLINETIRKMKFNGPTASQTGPALRGDKLVMDKHFDALNGYSKEIYKLMSKSIQSKKKQ